MAQDENQSLVKIPAAVITLKDAITIVSIIVAMTLAWGVFGTRLTVVENELVYQMRNIEQLQKEIDILKDKYDKLEQRVRDSEEQLRKGN